MKLSETSMLLNTSMNKKAPDEKPKLILRNIYQREKIRINKMTLKALEPGKIMIYLFNGEGGVERDVKTYHGMAETLADWADAQVREADDAARRFSSRSMASRIRSSRASSSRNAASIL